MLFNLFQINSYILQQFFINSLFFREFIDKAELTTNDGFLFIGVVKDGWESTNGIGVECYSNTDPDNIEDFFNRSFSGNISETYCTNSADGPIETR